MNSELYRLKNSQEHLVMYGMDSVESLETKCGVIKYSYSDIMVSPMTFLYFLGIDMILIHLRDSDHFERYLHG